LHLQIIRDDSGAIADFIFDYANNAYSKITGKKTEDVIGKNLNEIFGINQIQSWEKIKNALASMESYHYDKYIEVLDKYLSFSIFPIDNDKFGFITHDITGRKNYEKYLAERLDIIQFVNRISTSFINIDSEKIETEVARTLEDVCNYTGLDRGFYYKLDEESANTTLEIEFCRDGLPGYKDYLLDFELTGYAEYLGDLNKSEYILNDAESLETLVGRSNKLEEVLKILETNSSIHLPLRIKEKLFGILGFETIKNDFTWEKNKIFLIVLISKIISGALLRAEYTRNLIRLKEEAQSASKFKSTLIANVSHEIRTPLNGISGVIDLLKDFSDDEEFTSLIELQNESSKRLLKTLNMLIGISDAQSKLSPGRINKVDIAEAALNVFAGYQRKSTENLAVKINLIEDEIYVNSEYAIVENIIIQLMDNAFKFTREGEICLEIDSSRKKGKFEAIIRVIDSGIGIPDDKKDIIFEEFRQVSEGSSRMHEGLGLGLPLAKRLVEMSNGSLEFVSSPDKGSTFTVKFEGYK
jgi:PAS domain S-box-containing protein